MKYSFPSDMLLLKLETELEEARAQIRNIDHAYGKLQKRYDAAVAERDEARAQIAAKDELIRSFVLDMIDYMTKNDLGDPEQMHNIKWARKLGCHDTLAAQDEPFSAEDQHLIDKARENYQKAAATTPARGTE